MGKYSSYSSRPPAGERPYEVHPVWRGIGCLMMLIVPILAYAGSVLLVEANAEQRWITLPREMARSVVLPLVGSVPHLLANLAATLILSLIGFALVTSLYTIFYRMVGPGQLGPLDAPPERRRTRRK